MDLSTKFSTSVSPVRRARRWPAPVLIVAFLLAAAFAGWRYMSGPTAVSAAPVRRGPVAEVVYATGFVEPRRPVDVSSRVTAPVSTVLVDEGDQVSRGQALAMLDAEDQRETIAQLTSNRVNAEQDERRALELFRQGWSTNAVRDKAVATANSARALEAAGRARLNQYTIRSGISGVILRRDVEPGDLATASKTLFEIGDPKQLRITATVDERDIPRVRTGSAVMMSTEAYPGQVLRGTVYEITPGGDPDQRAFRVRIRPEDALKLPVGLTLEVNILVSQRERALLVRPSAIRDGAVWLVENGKARHVAIWTGIRGPDFSEITSGLSDGACVITDPPPNLKNGDRVSVKGC
jgi:RND family efflux transporter MFP subunit